MDSKQSLSRILTSRINALSKISRCSSFKNRKLIANGIVMSHLTYLVQLYGGCSEYLLSALQVQQNRAARLVTRLGWWTPTSTLLLQCGWLSIRQMVIYQSLLLLSKTKQNMCPENIFFLQIQQDDQKPNSWRHSSSTRHFGRNHHVVLFVSWSNCPKRLQGFVVSDRN